MQKINNLFLFTILFIAALIRIALIDSVPPSLNWDEVSIGYNAYSILKTGKDEWGNSWPLSFRAYGDYKLPGYVYLDTPFVAIFGLTNIGVRLPSALLGVGVVFFIYEIIKRIRDKQTAIYGAFLASITPWEIIVSRIGLEAHLALFLTTAGVYFFFKGINRPNFLFISALLFGISIFSYNSSRVVTPIIIVLLGFLYRKVLVNNRTVVLSVTAVFLMFFVLALPYALKQDSSARYVWTKIIDDGAIARINQMRGESNLPSILSKISYNKVTYFSEQSGKNYISHFNPDFLFLNGGSNYQFSVPGTGLLYPFSLIFILWGIIYMIINKRVEYWLIFGWLLIGFIPAAITRDAPHALRSLFVIPPFIIISAIGITYLSGFLGKISKVYFLAVIGVFILSFFQFWHIYTNDYISKYSWSWQYGYKEAVDFAKQNYDSYDTIIITKKYGEPHEFFLFYWPWDPLRFRQDANLIRFEQSQWFWVDRFDKFYFMNDWNIPKSANGQWKLESGGIVPISAKTLLITSPGNYPSGWEKLKTIYFKDKEPAFDIVRPS